VFLASPRRAAQPEVNIFEIFFEEEVLILFFAGRHRTGLRALERVREPLGQGCCAGAGEGKPWGQRLGSLSVPV